MKKNVKYVAIAWPKKFQNKRICYTYHSLYTHTTIVNMNTYLGGVLSHTKAYTGFALFSFNIPLTLELLTLDFTKKIV